MTRPTTYRYSLRPSEPFRVCPRCGEHIETLAAWRELELAGFMSNDGECLEIRNHQKCGTTLALVLVPHPADVIHSLGVDDVG